MRRNSPSSYERLLVDDTMLAYVEWREECAALRTCERHWRGGTAKQAVCAHTGYLAALEREEAAARVYAERLELLGDVLRRRELGNTHDQARGTVSPGSILEMAYRRRS